MCVQKYPDTVQLIPNTQVNVYIKVTSHCAIYTLQAGTFLNKTTYTSHLIPADNST